MVAGKKRYSSHIVVVTNAGRKTEVAKTRNFLEERAK